MTILKKKFQKPLHITISVLFIVLIFIIGLVLNLYNYQKTTAIVISATNNLFTELADKVVMNFEATYSPVLKIVSLLSHTNAVKGTTLEQHLEAVPLFIDILKGTPAISGLQIGYENGNSFIIRPLVTEKEHIFFSAPEDALYLCDYVSSGVSGGRLLQRVFFNGQLQEISRSVPVRTEYNPHKRPWYIQAVQSRKVVSTSPYLFYFLDKVGVTISRKVPGESAVVAVDITLEQVAETLAHTTFSPNEKKVLLDKNGRVLVNNGLQLVDQGNNEAVSLSALKDIDTGILKYVADTFELKPGQLHFSYEGRDWLGMLVVLDIGYDFFPRLLMLVPADDMLVEARHIRTNVFCLTLLTLCLAIPIVWFISCSISKSLQQLALEARLISRFDFSSSLTVSTHITEVSELAASMQMMQQTVSHFITLIQAIAGEKEFETTLKRISRETMVVSRADMVVSYLVDEKHNILIPDIILDHHWESVDCKTLSAVPVAAFLPEQGVDILRLRTGQDQDLGGLAGVLNTEELTVIPISLYDRQGDLMGVLALLYQDIDAKGELASRLSFTRAFSGFAAVSLETRQLIRKQKQLLNSFIGLLAGAIDEKSSYTGGHCQRVPVITKMLARAACASRAEPFKNFSLNDEEREELHIASWLHDCGKVTTPEYVVDKATKLETLYNRIHEIRTRFEILKRDAEVEYWQQVAEGGDRESLRQRLEKKWQQLDDDFSFVAACNSGDESLGSEHLERLRSIYQRTWLRTLDDRLGLSWQEMRLKEREQNVDLPVREPLLADIFEALTASDRPYKKAKKLSEALHILYFMKKDQHVDPQLFDLFLTSGVYLEYAEKYLDPEQIDAVDISDYLG